MGTPSEDFAHGVAVDSSGNAYVAGWTEGGLDGNTNAGSWDIVLIEYDTNGNKLWTRQMGTSAGDGAYGVAVDSNSNAYVAGFTWGGLDGNTYSGSSDFFLIKYDTNGNKLWTRRFMMSVILYLGIESFRPASYILCRKLCVHHIEKIFIGFCAGKFSEQK